MKNIKIKDDKIPSQKEILTKLIEINPELYFSQCIERIDINEYTETSFQKMSYTKNSTNVKMGKLKINVNKINISSEIDKKFSYLHLKLFPGIELKFLILNLFKNELTYDFSKMDMKCLKELLIKETDLIAENLNKYNIYKIQYLSDLEENNFCVNILKMYNESGFLFDVVNKILKGPNLKEFLKIQCYYVSLLAVFEHSSSRFNKTIFSEPTIPSYIINNINLYQKLYIYKFTTLSKNEIKHLQTDTESIKIKIFNEFLSCTLNKDMLPNLGVNCMIDLEVDYQINTENNYFTFYNSDLTSFITEREVLLKSGVIIVINSFYEHPDRNVTQYVIKGKVISFNDPEFVKCSFKDCKEETINFRDSIIDTYSENIKYFSEGLKDNSTITNLDLRESFPTSLENMRNITEAIKQNRKIRTLYLESRKIGLNYENVRYLSEIIKQNWTITNLYIGRSKIGSNSENIKCLSEAIKQNKTITKLDLGKNKLGFNPEDLKCFSDAIIKNKTITTLNLSDNKIGSNSENIKYLSNILKENKIITSISLWNNSFGSSLEEIKYLTEALRESKTITILDLGYNKIGLNVENMKYLCEALKQNNTISKICLLGNSFGLYTENMKYLANTLKENNTIISLDLGFNSIGSSPDKMMYLSEIIKENNTITSLGLWNNSIGINLENMKYLSDGLKLNKSITKLDLRCNSIGSNCENIKYLSEALKENMNIVELYIENNSIGNEFIDQFRKIRKNLSIVS